MKSPRARFLPKKFGTVSAIPSIPRHAGSWPATASARHGIGCDGHRARRITQKDVDSFDRIYYMDSSNLRWLNRMFPGETKFRPFLDRNVADPWYTGDFTQTWADITEGCCRIMEEV